MRVLSYLAAIATISLTVIAAVAAEPDVQIFRPDGTLQCGMGKKIPIADMKAELAKAHIDVLNAREGNDGLMHPMLCGAATGNINIFTIASKDLEAARKLGFEPYSPPKEP